MSFTSTMTHCTLVWEFNYSEGSRALASVWLFAGDARRDLESELELAAAPGWFRIIGPVDQELASSTHAALKSFLISAGVVVYDEGVAD